MAFKGKEFSRFVEEYIFQQHPSQYLSDRFKVARYASDSLDINPSWKFTNDIISACAFRGMDAEFLADAIVDKDLNNYKQRLEIMPKSDREKVLNYLRQYRSIFVRQLFFIDHELDLRDQLGLGYNERESLFFSKLDIQLLSGQGANQNLGVRVVDGEEKIVSVDTEQFHTRWVEQGEQFMIALRESLTGTDLNQELDEYTYFSMEGGVPQKVPVLLDSLKSKSRGKPYEKEVMAFISRYRSIQAVLS